MMQFHCQLPNVPHELRFFWGVTLLGYVVLKEVFRWHGLSEGMAGHWGELYVALVIGSFLWMQGWNLVRLWVYGVSCLTVPEGAVEGAIEALTLWIASVISSLLHYNRKNGKDNKSARY
ncbi:MAG: hypothetical protein HY813_01750 [Candidatus Portnoybacteria bacterium]|nr:hypothetical protein [Candidatus Portnoybacteria bacterium]